VQTGKRHARLGQVSEHSKVRPKKGRLTNAVHGLDLPHGSMKICLNNHEKSLLGAFNFGFIEENARGNFLKEVPPDPLKNL
jgi:hypothetical protein